MKRQKLGQVNGEGLWLPVVCAAHGRPVPEDSAMNHCDRCSLEHKRRNLAAFEADIRRRFAAK